MSNPNQVSDDDERIPGFVNDNGIDLTRVDDKRNDLLDALVLTVSKGDQVSGWKFDIYELADFIIARETAARQSLLAEIAERGPKKWGTKNSGAKDSIMWSQALGHDKAVDEWRKLLTELAEEGDKSKQEPSE